MAFAVLSDARIFAGSACSYGGSRSRFVLALPLDGDIRVTIGVMAVLCKHCGWN